MSLRSIVEDRAFRALVAAGVGVGVVNLVVTYVETGQIDLVGLALFVVLVAVVGTLLVTYWSAMEQSAEAE